MTRAEARQEILEARELARQRGAEMTIGEVIQAVYEASRYQPIETPEPVDTGPRFAYYAVGNARWSSIRRVPIQ
jgi:hypothetical protein